MARTPLTAQTVDGIISASKSIQGDVMWAYRPIEGYTKCQIAVNNELGLNLKIYGNLNMEETSIFSFSLILNNAYRIRGLDVNGSHGNKHTDRNEWRSKTHKHKWSDHCREAFAYTPEDIFNPKDIEQAFKTFCQECNIDFKGVVKTIPPKQIGMKI